MDLSKDIFNVIIRLLDIKSLLALRRVSKKIKSMVSNVTDLKGTLKIQTTSENPSDVLPQLYNIKKCREIFPHVRTIQDSFKITISDISSISDLEFSEPYHISVYERREQRAGKIGRKIAFITKPVAFILENDQIKINETSLLLECQDEIIKLLKSKQNVNTIIIPLAADFTKYNVDLIYRAKALVEGCPNIGGIKSSSNDNAGIARKYFLKSDPKGIVNALGNQKIGG